MYVKKKKNVPFIHLLFLAAINSTPDRNRLSIYSTCRSLSHSKEKQKTSRVDITVNTKISHFNVINFFFLSPKKSILDIFFSHVFII